MHETPMHKIKMFLTPAEALKRGLKYVGYDEHRQGRVASKTNVQRFKSHYGSSPLIIASMWYDLCHTDIPAALLHARDKCERGFKKFLVAHFFLWAKPKNTDLLASRFGLNNKEVSGENLWYWLKKMQGLKSTKIKWHDRLNDPNGPKMIISVDGVDFKIWEPKNPCFNTDRTWFSKKFKAAGCRYEIAVDIWTSKIVWINGPYKCGSYPDVTIFQYGGLMNKIATGKKGIADRGYVGCEEKLCMPSESAPLEVRRFMSRVRCRHETCNGRIKKFDSMVKTWTHGVEKHKIALEAVSVIVQYQFDNGAPLFDP